MRFFIVIIALVFTGCAAPAQNVAKAHPPIPKVITPPIVEAPKPVAIPYEILKIAGVDYIPLSSVVKDVDMKVTWDSTAQVVTLRRSEFVIRMRSGSRVSLINGQMEAMDEPFYANGRMAVLPASFYSKTLAELFSAIPKVPAVAEGPRVNLVKKVCIDAGHGGKDPGAIGRGGLKEKVLTLDIAKRLRDELVKDGIEVVMTREADRFIPLPVRAKIANDSKADFFISIHANSAKFKGASGLEVYYVSDELDDTKRALEDASEYSADVPKDIKPTILDLIYSENRIESQELARYLLKLIDENLAVRNRGIKNAQFFVLRKTHMPAVLVEVGFISNKEEESHLRRSYYKDLVAQTLADGILAYKGEYERTDGFSD